MNNSIETVSDLQLAVAAALESVKDLLKQGRLPQELAALRFLAPPEEMNARVSLRHAENDRQIKSTASIGSWVPGACGVWVEYGAQEQPARNGATWAGAAEDDRQEILRQVHRLEVTRPKGFIAWTWFRDQHLRTLGWRLPKDDTQRLLSRLVEDELLLTERVANPRSPEHPTTTLRLNRKHPEIVRLLGVQSAAGRFQPIELPGEPVSETILRERR